MGNSASAPSDFKAVARRHFPFKGDVALGQTSVVVPIWNGKGNIFTVQKMHPYDIPIHPLPEGCVLPGETVHAADVPSQLYNLTPVDAEGYPHQTKDYHPQAEIPGTVELS